MNHADQARAPWNRDPADQAAIAQAFNLFITSQNRDEASIAFEQALLNQGVMNPDEAIQAFEPFDEPDVGIGTVVILETGETFLIWDDGSVTES